MGRSVKAPDAASTIRDKMRHAVEKSGMTQEEVGLRMGFAKNGARKAVSRLLSAEADHDPRLSTLISFAKALGKNLQELL